MLLCKSTDGFRRTKHLSSYTHLYDNYFTATNNACLKKENWQVLISKVMELNFLQYVQGYFMGGHPRSVKHIK
jgi:hypothetical protein